MKNEFNKTRFEYKKNFQYIHDEINKNKVFIDCMLGSKVNGELYYACKYILENSHKELVIAVNKYIKDYADYFGLDNKFNKRIIQAERGGQKYFSELYTSKFLLSDAAFCAGYCKRKEQIYYNTWHGLPLKFIGKDIKEHSIFNAQVNLNNADKIIVNSTFLKDILSDKYELSNRNFKFYPYLKNNLINILNSDNNKNKILLLYTWRTFEKKRKKSIKKYSKFIYNLTKELNNSISKTGKLNNYEINIKIHHLVDEKNKLNKIPNVKTVPFDIETTQLISQNDIIISDFSSVIFDSIYMKKKTIIDLRYLNHYEKERGIYRDVLDDIPAYKANNLNELIDCIITNTNRYNSNTNRYNSKVKDFKRKYFEFQETNHNWVPDFLMEEK